MTPEMHNLMALYTANQRLMDAYEGLIAAGRRDLADDVRRAGKIVADAIGKLSKGQQVEVAS